MPKPRGQTGRLHCPRPQQPTLQPFVFFFWKGRQTGPSLCSCSDTAAAVLTFVFISPSDQGLTPVGEAALKDPDKRQPCPGMMWPAPCRPALRLSTTAPEPSHLCLTWIPERASPKSVLMIARVTSCYFCFQNHLVASHLTQHEVHFLPQPVALTPSDLSPLCLWSLDSSPPAAFPLPSLHLAAGSALAGPAQRAIPGRPGQGASAGHPPLLRQGSPSAPSVTALVCPALPSPPRRMEAPRAGGCALFAFEVPQCLAQRPVH